MQENILGGSDGKSGTPLSVNLPSNSYTSRQAAKKEESEKKPIERVTSGAVIQKKRGMGSKIRENFTGDDARSVGHYIFFDVIIPAAKNMLFDATSQGVERMLFGDSRGRNRPSSSGRSGSGYTSYNRMYDNKSRDNAPRELSTRARSSHDFDEIILEERGEAEAVIDELSNLIDEYGQVKVTDLYSLVGISGNYTDDKWGWVDLRTATTTRVRQGYLLDLPKPIFLK